MPPHYKWWGHNDRYNTNLGLNVNIKAYIKFGKILSICSQDFEWKRNSDVNQGP